MLNSSLTGRTDQEVDWSSDTNTNSRYFQPSGTGLSRIDQAAVKLKNDREMVSKSHIRKKEGIHRKSLYRKEITVNHEVMLPELIESDEEYETESGSEHPNNEDGKQASHTAMHETYVSLKKESQNNFQPTGRNRFCMGNTEADHKKNGYDSYRNIAPKKIIGRNYEEETEEPTTANLHGKRDTERRRPTLPKATVQKDEINHNKGKEQRDIDEVPQKLIRPPGEEVPCMRKMKEEKMIAQDDD